MAVAGSVVVELLAKTGSFETDIDRATKDAAKRMADFKKAVAASFAGNLLADFAKGFLDRMMAIPGTVLHTVDALNDVADATGASIEKISALEDIGARTGTSMDVITSTMIKFNQVLMDTDPDSKGARALKQIGLNADDLRKMDPADALHKMALALANFADDADKARLVQELFGKQTRTSAAFLKDLADKTELVGTVSTEQAKQAEAFNQQLAAMQKNSADAARSFIADLLPAINAAAKAWKESGLVAGIQVLLTGTDVNKANVEIVRLTDLILSTQNKIDAERAKKAAGGLGGFLAGMNLPTYEAYLGRLKEQLRSAQALVTVSEPGFFKGPEADKPSVGPIVPKAKKEPKEKKGKDEDADFKQYMNQLEQQIQKVDKLTAAEKLEDDIRRGHLTVSPEQHEQLRVLAANVDKHKEWTERMKAGRDAATAEGEAVEKANEAYQERLKVMLDSGPAAQLEKQRADVALLTAEFQKFIDTAGQAGITEAQYTDALTGYLHLQGEQAKQSTGMIDGIADALGNAAEGAVFAGGTISDVFKGMLTDIARVIFRLGAMEPAIKRLKEAMSGASTGSSGGGFFETLFGAALSSIGGGIAGGAGDALGMSLGGTYGSGTQAGLDTLVNSLAGRAAGGPVSAGAAYVVGESGRELFVPTNSGRVVPVADGAAAGTRPAEMRVSLINQTQSPVDRVVQQRLSDQDMVLVLQQTRRMVVGDMGDQNSAIHKAMTGNLQARTRRG